MRLLPLALLAAVPAGLFAQHTYTPADIQEGGRLFRANCVLCHGPDGDQVPGIDLGHGRFRQTYSENALVKIIQNGIPGTGIYYTSHSGYQSGVHSAHVETPISPEQQQRAHSVGGWLALAVIVGLALIIGIVIGSASH